MLSRLYIQDFAIIRSLELELANGFLALTGETGAGKSIIIDALNLAMGGKADKDSIASGAERARVEAVFAVEGEAARAIEEMGFAPEGGEIILSRELAKNGRSTCRCNGALVTQGVLREVSDALVDIHGQHEHQSLLQPSKHLAFVDAFGANTIAPLAAAVAKTASEWKEINAAMRGEVGDESERIRRMDMLSYQIAEIEDAALRPEEEEQLRQERDKLRHHERIESALAAAYAALYENEEGSALQLLRMASGEVNGIRSLDSEYEALAQRVEDAYYAVEDIAREVRDARPGDFDPARRDALEERLDVIDTLKRKYGPKVEDVLAYLEKAQEELLALSSYEEKQAHFAEKIEALCARYAKEAAALSGERQKQAARLSELALGHMAELGLAKSRFEVQFHKNDAHPRTAGWDEAEFYLTTNAGEPLRPLHKVASGGEMSRIMLSLKTVAAKGDAVHTLIFDEIDTGISGRTALFVGEKLRALAGGGHQVICVTHQAQIAALANAQYRIEKHEESGRTAVSVQKLSEEARIGEIARMMGGEQDSTSAQKLAVELLARGGA